jgi:hypothetical protein
MMTDKIKTWISVACKHSVLILIEYWKRPLSHLTTVMIENKSDVDVNGRCHR